MMLWRGLLYLALIAQLHYIWAILVSGLALAVFPDRFVAHFALALPVFVLGIWYGVPMLMRVLRLVAGSDLSITTRFQATGGAVLALLMFILPATGAGITAATPFLASTTLIICLHIWLIRHALRP